MPREASAAVLLLLLLLLICVGEFYAAQPLIYLRGSEIYGVSTQVGSTTVDKYLGIRFAQPPLGELRFKKPEPAPFHNLVNATSHGYPCMGLFQLPGLQTNEDCLFLDVYVPRKKSKRTGGSLVPVMMWIYGGAFLSGSNAEFSGETLAAEGNVILVAANYRVGPFGFLSTGDNSSRGNFGLWDQWLALKWIHNNIDQFGGDTNSITLIGESAGSAIVSHLMTSPYSTNMFHRAILQSGCRLCHWAYNSSYSPLDKANQLANITGCPTTTDNDTESLVNCLREKKEYELQLGYRYGLFEWSPVIDGDFVLPYSAAPKFGGTVMAGLNNREGGYSVRVRKRRGEPLNMRTYYHKVLLKTLLSQIYNELTHSADDRDVENVLEAVDEMYKVQKLSNHSYVSDEELEAVIGDTDFFVCNRQLFDSNPSTGNAYLYYFDHYPETPNGKKGMDHGYDLLYTFGFNGGVADSDFAGYNITAKDLDLAEDFRSILTNFVQTGNPYKPRALPDNWPSWPLYKKGEESYLTVSFSPEECNHLKKNRMSFWLNAVPSLLQSKGPLSFNKTRFRHCVPYVRPTGAADFAYVTKTVFLLCFVALFILY